MHYKQKPSSIPKPPMNEIKAEKIKEEWIMDEKGYFLIDPHPDKHILYAHHYNKNKQYTCSISGKTAEEVYYTILRHNLISSLMHACYLGSELQKAEVFINQKKGTYIQDEALKL